MIDVLQGFFVIWVVILTGLLTAHFGILGEQAQRGLSRIAFLLAMPCLMFGLVSTTDIGRLFHTNILVSILAVAISAGLYFLISLRWDRTLSGRIIGMYGASYQNANNMGVPIAAYVLGDTSWVAPLLLLQLLILQPLGLTVLDARKAKRDGKPVSWVRNLTLPFRNPLTVATLLGLIVNLAGWKVPQLVMDPIELIAGMAVPSMLLAFGIALRLSPLPKLVDLAEVGVISLLKLLVMPLSALLLAHFVFGLDPVVTMAVTVMAGLPTAQNVFIFAMRYEQSIRLARDVVTVTSVGSVPCLMVVVALAQALTGG